MVVSHLGVFPAHVAVHGGSCGDFGAAQVAALSLHLLMGQLHVFLQHILRHILLVTDGARKCLSNCKREKDESKYFKLFYCN